MGFIEKTWPGLNTAKHSAGGIVFSGSSTDEAKRRTCLHFLKYPHSRFKAAQSILAVAPTQRLTQTGDAPLFNQRRFIPFETHGMSETHDSFGNVRRSAKDQPCSATSTLYILTTPSSNIRRPQNDAPITHPQSSIAIWRAGAGHLVADQPHSPRCGTGRV